MGHLHQVYERHLLEHDVTGDIVKRTFTNNDGVELRIDLALVEDGEDGGRICGNRVEPKTRRSRRQIEQLKTEHGPEVNENVVLCGKRLPYGQ